MPITFGCETEQENFFPKFLVLPSQTLTGFSSHSLWLTWEHTAPHVVPNTEEKPACLSPCGSSGSEGGGCVVEGEF